MPAGEYSQVLPGGRKVTNEVPHSGGRWPFCVSIQPQEPISTQPSVRSAHASGGAYCPGGLAGHQVKTRESTETLKVSSAQGLLLQNWRHSLRPLLLTWGVGVSR